MTKVWTPITVSVAILVFAQAVAVDAVGQLTLSQRQIVINCMKKRMSVDRGISYNAAAKVCKSEVNRPSNNPVSVAAVASDSPAKR